MGDSGEERERVGDSREEKVSLREWGDRGVVGVVIVWVYSRLSLSG